MLKVLAKTTTRKEGSSVTDTIITLNEQTLKNQLGELVRASVEETLNKMLDAEADQLANAGKYERTAARKDTRAGHYQRKLTTKAGEVTLNVPKLRHLPFETAIIERYKRRESSIEEALIEMYLAGVSGLSIILCKHSCFRTPAIEYIPPNDLQNRSKTGPISGPSFESGRSTFS